MSAHLDDGNPGFPGGAFILSAKKGNTFGIMGDKNALMVQLFQIPLLGPVISAGSPIFSQDPLDIRAAICSCIAYSSIQLDFTGFTFCGKAE